MPDRCTEFDPPERFVAGTVGEPGRAHVLPAGPRRAAGGRASRWRSSRCGARRAHRRAARRGDARGRPAPRRSRRSRRSSIEDPEPLEQPIDEEFRVGTMTLALGPRDRAGGRSRARRSIEDEERRPRAGGGPRATAGVLRVRLAGALARAFVKRAQRGRRGRPSAVPVLRRPARPRRPHLPPGQRLPALSRTVSRARPRGADDRGPAAGRLRQGELELAGPADADACNATFVGTRARRRRGQCVYKPVAGERPLWDFPDGTLGRPRGGGVRGLARPPGWGMVPPTVLRRRAARTGMVQVWLEPDDRDGREPVDLVPADARCPTGCRLRVLDGARTPRPAGRRWCTPTTRRLRRMAVFDAVVNNADRKGGHVCWATTRTAHRCTASTTALTFHVEDKLRTVLWGWAGEPWTPAPAALRRLAEALGDRARRRARRGAGCSTGHADESSRATRRRVDRLLRGSRRRCPAGGWPAHPVAARSEPVSRTVGSRPCRAWPAPARAPIAAGHRPPGPAARHRRAGRSRRPRPDRPARLYVCGITPYDATHMGHAATYVAFDLLHRAWRDAGHEVHYVQNVTDVDDPLLERATQSGEDWQRAGRAGDRAVPSGHGRAPGAPAARVRRGGRVDPAIL